MRNVLIILIFCFLLPVNLRAEDTYLGNLKLSKNQHDQLFTVNVPPFYGFAYREDGTVIGTSDSSPSQQQISEAFNAIKSISDTPSKQLLVNRFSVEKFVEDLNASLSGDSVLFQYYAVMKDWAAKKRFSSIKAFLNSLVSGGVITQDLEDSINNIFKNQGIDLNDF